MLINLEDLIIMYEELKIMTEAQRNTIQERIDIVRSLPPFGDYINWGKWLHFAIALILLGYAYSWVIAPHVGVINWINRHVEGGSLILTTWAFIGSTILINYATIKDRLPLHWNFFALFPLIIHGIAAAISNLAIVATIAHPAIGLLLVLFVLFFNSTLRQYANDVAMRQEIQLLNMTLQKENAQLKLELQMALETTEGESHDEPNSIAS